MAYSEFLADRVRMTLQGKRVPFEEKIMFGGICFMVDDKMCMGVIGEELMARIDPDYEPLARSKTGARPMDFTGRPMKGYLFVGAEGIDSDRDMEYWVDLCLEFNPKAKSSKKKKK